MPSPYKLGSDIRAERNEQMRQFLLPLLPLSRKKAIAKLRLKFGFSNGVTKDFLKLLEDAGEIDNREDMLYQVQTEDEV